MVNSCCKLRRPQADQGDQVSVYPAWDVKKQDPVGWGLSKRIVVMDGIEY